MSGMSDTVTIYVQLPGRSTSCALKASLSNETVGDIAQRLVEDRVELAKRERGDAEPGQRHGDDDRRAVECKRLQLRLL